MLINVIILSIVEGITEFLPVSSTGHLIILSEWLKMDKEFANVFDVAIQLGAILAVVFLFPIYFKKLIKPKNLFSKQNKTIFVAIGPILCMGFLFRDIIKTYLFSSNIVFTGFIIGGVGLILVDFLYKDKTNQMDMKEAVTLKQGFIIGLFQCLALWPGMSRSGCTIIGGVISGLNVTTAAAFSFIIAVPIILIAVLYDLLMSVNGLSIDQIGWIILGMILSFVIAYLSMRWFLGFIKNQGLYLFGIYRIILGGLGIIFF